MASPITPSTGLGSGIAIGSIVDALVKADKTPKQNQIDKQTTLNTTKLSGVATLKSAMDAYQAALTKLGSTTTPAFNGYAATSTSTNATALATNTAVPGTYSVTVDKLATSSSVATAAFAGGTSSVIPSGGTLTITQNGIGSNYVVPSGATLLEVRDLVNARTSTTGLNANIITDANGSRLVFGSTKTGTGTDLTASGIPELEVTNGPLDLTPGATKGGYIGLQATDAQMTVGGIVVTSTSNTFDKALSGVTLTAVTANSSPFTVTVGNNTDGLKASLQTFVDAYNTVVKTINSLTKATADSSGALTKAAAMTGDAMPRNILAALRNVLSTEGPGTKLTSLAQLGIMTDRAGGTLSFDANKFTTAMNDKGMAGEIQNLFSGTNGTNGLVSRMTEQLKPYTKTGGILADRTTGINKAQTILTRQQEALDIRITNLTNSLTAKYNAMDLLVGQMKASATSITSFFEALNAQKS